MTLTIKSKTKNILLGRNEIVADLEYQAVTPSNTDVQKQLASAEKCDEKLVKVKQIANIFGKRKAIVKAYIYDSEEHFKKIEEVKKHPRKKKGAAAAEAKKGAK